KLRNGDIPLLINSSPKNNAPKPNIVCPIAVTFWFLKKNIKKQPIAIMGNAYSPISNPIINEVTDVPIIATMMTQNAYPNVINPALANHTIQTDDSNRCANKHMLTLTALNKHHKNNTG